MGKTSTTGTTGEDRRDPIGEENQPTGEIRPKPQKDREKGTVGIPPVDSPRTADIETEAAAGDWEPPEIPDTPRILVTVGMAEAWIRIACYRLAQAWDNPELEAKDWEIAIAAPGLAEQLNEWQWFGRLYEAAGKKLNGVLMMAILRTPAMVRIMRRRFRGEEQHGDGIESGPSVEGSLRGE